MKKNINSILCCLLVVSLIACSKADRSPKSEDQVPQKHLKLMLSWDVDPTNSIDNKSLESLQEKLIGLAQNKKIKVWDDASEMKDSVFVKFLSLYRLQKDSLKKVPIFVYEDSIYVDTLSGKITSVPLYLSIEVFDEEEEDTRAIRFLYKDLENSEVAKDIAIFSNNNFKIDNCASLDFDDEDYNDLCDSVMDRMIKPDKTIFKYLSSFYVNKENAIVKNIPDQFCDSIYYEGKPFNLSKGLKRTDLGLLEFKNTSKKTNISLIVTKEFMPVKDTTLTKAGKIAQIKLSDLLKDLNLNTDFECKVVVEFDDGGDNSVVKAFTLYE